MTGGLHFALLGPLRCTRDGHPVELGPPREKALLAVLLLRRGGPVPAGELLAAVWGDEAPATGARVLPPYVYRLRRRLDGSGEPSTILRVGGGYQLRPGAVGLDVEDLDRLGEEGRRLRATGDPDAASAALRQAEELWRGVPLAGLPGPFLAGWRRRVTAQQARVVEERIRADLDRGRHADVVSELVALADREPVSEAAVELLVIALQRCGRQADALAAYAALRVRLARDLGLEPSARLQAVQHAVLHGDPTPAGPDGTVGLPAADGPGGGRCQLPRLSTGFVGRAAELAEITAEATAQVHRIPVVALDGMAGVGKTTLALAAAHRLAGLYPDGQLFLDLWGHTPAQAPLQPFDALDALLRAAGVTGPLPDDLDERAALWRATLHRRRVLLVLDNVRSADQVEPLLPAEPDCLVLVTGRHRLTDLNVTAALSLDVLPETDAAALLLGIAGREHAGDDPAAAREVVRIFGRLPLAIRIGGVRLRHPDAGSLSQFAGRLSTHDDLLAELSAGDRSVRAAFELSYGELDPAAQRTFRLLALVPGAELDPYGAAALTGAGLAEATDVLDRLLDANLLQQPRADRFRFHDLLRQYAGTLVQDRDPAGERAAARTRLLDYYLIACQRAAAVMGWSTQRLEEESPTGVPPQHVPSIDSAAGVLEWLDTEADDLVAATVAAEVDHPVHAWRLAGLLTPYLALRFRFGRVDDINRAGLAGARRLGDQAAESALLIFRGHLHAAAGRMEAAMADYRDVVRLKRGLGDRFGEMTALNNLANMELTLGRYADSRRHLSESMAAIEALGDQRGAAYVQVNLAELSDRTGRHEDALAAAQAAEALAAGVDNDRRVEAYALCMQARASIALGRPAEALSPLARAAELATRLEDHLNLAISLTYLGAATAALGDPAAGLEHHERAARAAARTGLPEAVQLVSFGHADTLLAAGRPADARRLFQRALDLHEKVWDPHGRDRAVRGLQASRAASAPIRTRGSGADRPR